VTVRVDGEDPGLADTAVSARVVVTNGVGIAAKRAMWWPASAATWTEAHNAHGAAGASRRWTVAGGEIGGPRLAETYLLIANTSEHAGAASVTLLVEGRPAQTKTFFLAPSSRTNVAVATEFPTLGAARFGAVVESTGAAPVDLVVERATYWNAAGEQWAAGTDTLATPAIEAEATIEITPEGLSPDHVEVPVGGRIRLVNRTSQPAFIASDPHPGHFVCRAMDPVGRLGPGETAISGPFRMAQDCTLHEHLAYDPKYHATVVVR
jgi:hypothetical protein